MSFDGTLALRYIAGVMNSGGSLEEALRALADEAPEPLRRAAAARIASAGAVSTAQQRVARLFAERDFKLARAALSLAQDAGGSVAPLLERCARQLEERRRWEQRRRALSAQTVASAWIVGSLPFAIIATLLIVAPDYLAPLFQTSLGRAGLALSLLFALSGLWMVRRMVRNDD